jgi:hypothetical protein
MSGRRALGAVGVLPKQVELVEVLKVLQSRRVIGSGHVGDSTFESSSGDKKISGEFPSLEILGHDLRFLIQDLFDQQRAVLRRDLLDSYETIAGRDGYFGNCFDDSCGVVLTTRAKLASNTRTKRCIGERAL